ncbi:MAG: DUF4177 domain-containing protein [Albidovulum sp.]
MQRYEFKVIPAPNRGEKARGLKTPADRFSHTLTALLNDLAKDGWEYIRADTLPADERSGLTKRVTVYHSVLVFRRAVAVEEDAAPVRALLTAEAPVGKAPAVEGPKPTPELELTNPILDEEPLSKDS